MKRSVDKPEQFKIQFLGFKFDSINPGKKTVLILVILLIFFLTLVLLLKSDAIHALKCNNKRGISHIIKTLF